MTNDKKNKNIEQPEGNADNSATYTQDRQTGEWKVNNPSGSKGYNYLYRDEWSWLD